MTAPESPRMEADLLLASCCLCSAPAASPCPHCGLVSVCARHRDLHHPPHLATCLPFAVVESGEAGKGGPA